MHTGFRNANAGNWLRACRFIYETISDLEERPLRGNPGHPKGQERKPRRIESTAAIAFLGHLPVDGIGGGLLEPHDDEERVGLGGRPDVARQPGVAAQKAARVVADDQLRLALVWKKCGEYHHSLFLFC